MKKVKYYKKMKEGKKIWYSESWGEPLDVALQNGKILHLVCEFYRGCGWYITDRETGLLCQRDGIPTKKQLTEYIKDRLEAYSRATDTEYYKNQKDELKQFLKKINEEGETKEDDRKKNIS